MRPVLFLFCLLFACYSSYGRNNTDTLNIYFNNGAYVLNAASKHSIDSLLYNDVIAPGRKVGIIGYADNLGAEASNKALSDQRAHAVQSYLLSMHIDSSDIEWVSGIGEVNRAENAKGYPQDRKVAIVPGGFNATSKKVPVAKRLGDIVHYVGDTPIIDASQMEVNTLFKLDRVYFQLGKSDLLHQSMPMLQALYRLMKDNPTIKVQVEGHICCSAPYIIEDGKKRFLKEGEKDTTTYAAPSDLSVYRALSVYAYLVYEKRIDQSRVKYVGYGVKRMLVNPEVTEEDKAANRRVEIRILAK